MRIESTKAWKATLAKVLVAVMIILSVAIVPDTAVRAASYAPSLNKTSRNILITKTYNLNVNNKIKGAKYVWTTSNKKIATVDQRGIVKGIRSGNATITCTVSTKSKKYTLTCNVTIIRGATVIQIKNKVAALNIGQAYNLDRFIGPSNSNDKTTWSSSDESIAHPDKNGKFTALKEGTVTITAKTLSGETDSVTIKVVDVDGTVTNQEELKALLGSGVANITIKTDADVDFAIPDGDYSKTKLFVDAPNADVTNSGKFASITIKQIKANTWVENAVGNLLKVLALNSRIVVNSNAKVQIEVSGEKAVLTIVNNGVIEKVEVTKEAAEAELTISGESEVNVPVVVNVPNIVITTSVPINVNATQKFDLVLKPGAEKSQVSATSEAVVPKIYGNVTIAVKVGTGSTTTTATVTGAPIQDAPIIIPPTNPTVTPTPSVTPSVTPSPTPTTTPTTKLTFDTAISNVSSVSVTTANNNTISADSLLLTFIKGLLTSPTAAADWSLITDSSYPISGQTVTIHGTSGSYTKTVSVTGGQYNGRTYTVAVSPDGSSVTLTNAGNISVTLHKSPDDQTFSITTSYTLQSGENSQTLADICNTLKTVSVTYSSKSYTIDVPEVVTIKKYIDNMATEAITWAGFDDDTRVVDGQTIHITGTLGSSTKTLTFVGGQFAGKVYTVTVNALTNTITVTNASNVTATIVRGSDTITVSLN